MTDPVRMSARPHRLGRDLAYSAFPVAAVDADGALALTWRHGTDHVNARDGDIRLTRSDDGGVTWDPATVIVPHPGNGQDLRDPSISVTADGTWWLTYFVGTAQLAAAGCFLRRPTDHGHTWGPAQRIDPDQPYAAICAPIVEHDGQLVTAYYGRHGSETRDSVFVTRSSDGGDTWSSTRIANGQIDGRDYQEPWALVGAEGPVVLFRWNTREAFGIVRSSGTTWTPPALAFPHATGRPSAAYTGSGALVVVYRRMHDGAVLYRASRDHGRTWYPPRRGQVITGSGWMTYAGPVTTGDGTIFCPTGIEEANGAVSRIWLSYIADSPVVSPLGDMFPDAVTRAATDIDQVLAVDDFDRPPAASLGATLTGQPWAGSGRVSEGYARGSGNNTVDFPVVNAGSPDVTVDADLSWSSWAGVGVLLRFKDANNHFLFTVEESGNKVRFYVRNNGVYYTLAEAGSVPVGPATWRRFTATIKGRRFLGFIDGQLVLAVNIGDVDTNLLGTQTRHGLKLNESGSVVHLCRRFVVRS